MATQAIPQFETRSKFRIRPIRDWPIRFKMVTAFLSLALVPMIFVAYFANRQASAALLAQGAISLQVAGHSTAERLDSELSEQREFIRVIGLMPELVRYIQNPNDAASRDAAVRVLTAAAEKARDYESVAIVSSEGKAILSSLASDVGTDLKFRPYFQEAMKGAAYISDPSVSVITNRPAIFFSAPIKDDKGNVLGVVRSRLKLDSIWDLVEQDHGIAGTGSFSMLLDENGIRLGDSNSKSNRAAVQDALLFRAIAPLPTQIEKALVDEKRFGRASEAGMQVVPLPELAARLASGTTDVFTTRSDINNTPNQAVIVNLASKPWHYVISAPQATFTEPADTLVLFIRVITVLVGIAAVAMAILASRSITRPIMHLAHVADRISLGELDAKVERYGNDEIGELADSIGRMQASLQAAIERLRARRTSA